MLHRSKETGAKQNILTGQENTVPSEHRPRRNAKRWAWGGGVLLACALTGILVVAVILPLLAGPEPPGRFSPDAMDGGVIGLPEPYAADLRNGADTIWPDQADWSDLSEDPIGQASFTVPEEDGLYPWIQAVDDRLRALIVYGWPGTSGLFNGDGSRRNPGEVRRFPLYEVDLRSGERREVLVLEDFRYPELLAVSDTYLFWREVKVPTVNSGMVTYDPDAIAPELHVTNRDTGRSWSFTTPELERAHYASEGPAPFGRPVLNGDRLLFGVRAVVPGGNWTREDFTTYLADLDAETVTVLAEEAVHPMLFRDSAAWLDVSRLSLNPDPDMPLGLWREHSGDPTALWEGSLLFPEDLMIAPWMNAHHVGMADEALYILDYGMTGGIGGSVYSGLRIAATPEARPLISAGPETRVHGNLMRGCSGISRMATGSWTHEHFVYDEQQDLMIRLDGIPAETLPLLNGRNLLSSELMSPPLRDVMVETDKLMYLSFDHPGLDTPAPGADGTPLTLYWIDTGSLPEE